MIDIFEKKPNDLLYLHVKSCVKKKLEALIDADRIPYCDSVKRIPDCLGAKKIVNDTASPLIAEESEGQQRKLSYYENV